MKSTNLTKPKLSSHEAAEFLGFSENTLRHSRWSGELAGVIPPAYRKLGRKVVYDRQTLITWLNQFEPMTNTAQEVA